MPSAHTFARAPVSQRRPNVWPHLISLTCVVGGALLAGCANPLPQYLNPRDATGSIVTAAISQQRDGSCRGVEEARTKALADAKAAEARVAAELVKPAPTVSRAWERMVGPPGSGTNAYDEARAANERATVLERELVSRNCGAVSGTQQADAGQPRGGLDATSTGWAPDLVPTR